MFDIKNNRRAKFRLTFRYCKNNTERKTAEKLAKELLSKDNEQFWELIKQLNHRSTTPVTTFVSGVTGTDNICNMWYEHFEELLRSCNRQEFNRSLTGV